MDIFKNLSKRKIESIKDDKGFSLLELVVAVGILLVLTVTGLVSYNSIMNNARDARVNNLAADLFMMAATHRSAGKDKEINSETLQNWATANGMTFEPVQTGECEVYEDTIKGEALLIKFSVDSRSRISVYVENTKNNYSVDRKEPGFDTSCS